jgi:hypothetical protein
MRALTYISFTVAMLGIWGIFNGQPIGGSMVYIVGGVTGAILLQLVAART